MIVLLIWKFTQAIFEMEYVLLTRLYPKPVNFLVDDGGGMDPEAMRRCMSFGFSDKKSKSAIGQCMDSSIHSSVSCDCFLSYLLVYL